MALISRSSAPRCRLRAPNTPANPFDFITPLTVIDANTVGLSVLRNGTTPFVYASGDFTAFTLQFQVRPGATPGAAANIVMVDDGVDNSWTQQDANPVTGVVYTQADVSVAFARADLAGHPVVPDTDRCLRQCGRVSCRDPPDRDRHEQRHRGPDPRHDNSAGSAVWDHQRHLLRCNRRSRHRDLHIRRARLRLTVDGDVIGYI